MRGLEVRLYGGIRAVRRRKQNLRSNPSRQLNGLAYQSFFLVLDGSARGGGDWLHRLLVQNVQDTPK